MGRIVFQDKLNELSDSLIEMADMVENNIEKALAAFETDNKELAGEIMIGDKEIDDMQRSIESQCLSLMLHQQPVAKDLRRVSSALKIVTDLERIGDHATDIAELVTRIGNVNVLNNVSHIIEMAAKAKAMMKNAIKAYVESDFELAEKTIADDDEVDELFNLVKEDVARALAEKTESIDDCIDIIMIAKYLERIGDHATNICEWAEFNQTGNVKNVRLM